MNSHRQPLRPSQEIPSSQPARGEPMTYIDNDGREEARLSGAHKEPYQVEFPGRVDKGHDHSYDSPGNHDASDPAACAPPLGDQCAGDFQYQVTEEEHARSKTDHSVVEAQVAWHLEGSGADVHAVQERDDIKQEQKGEESPRDSFSCALTNFQVGGYEGHSSSIRVYSEIGGGILHHFWHFATQNLPLRNTNPIGALWTGAL